MSTAPPSSRSSVPSAWPGSPSPLGATWDGAGVNFAVYSEHAREVVVCFFDDPRGPEKSRVRLAERTRHVFHGYVAGIGPGQLYGLRVDGPYDPEHGDRFVAAKLLVDPYARALAGKVDVKAPLLAYVPGTPKEDLALDDRDSSAGVPKSVVIDDSFPWGDDRAPKIPWNESVFYEMHVKGFTARHPKIDPSIRGTYAALASEPAVDHLRQLGITAVELLPVHAAADEGFLVGRGLTNFWGYNTLGFFAPDARYSASGDRGGQVREFKTMVRALHRAGIEVILDVVYNHTCEGDRLGPHLSLRGIDNRVYYRTVPDKPRFYFDTTGCGNTLDLSHPQVIKLVLDSLRYWVTEMHVDGFRFDLATALGRESHHLYERGAAFFDAVHQDPVLAGVKMIAEPWDLGDGGYRVGDFPVGWAEWNGKYRDCARKFWVGTERDCRELGYRLTGSSDLFALSGRSPQASVNFVTAHDGFTLHDLYTYGKKHNEANREDNRDGESHNNGWNCGVEGETSDAEVLALRDRLARNQLAMLLLSQGVPMIVAGDELGRTQKGNNNAYCQDNDISWVDWELDERRRSLCRFVRHMIALRREHPVFRRTHFFRGVHVRGSDLKDLGWFKPDGTEMSGDDWDAPQRTIALLLGGDAIGSNDAQGRPIVDETFLVVLNGERESVRFKLPNVEWAAWWELLVDTDSTEQFSMPIRTSRSASTEIDVEGLSIVLLQSIPKP